ncbi:MAG: asparagine synthase, partial [Thermoplasmata archaeon]
MVGCDMQEYVSQLMSALENSIKRCVEGEYELGILFSGGLDSSLIAYLAKKHAGDARLCLYTVGLEDSQDLKCSEEAAHLLGMELRKVIISTEEVLEAVPKVSHIIGSRHPVKLTFELPLYFCLQHVGEDMVLGGQGADELFGGYARYLKMEEEDLESALKTDVKNLIDRDIRMDRRLAAHFQKVLKTPYLDPDVMKTAMDIPVKVKVDQGRRKIILREAAARIGLPLNIRKREKRAAQYGSGILKTLRKAAKGRGMQANELIEHLLMK